MNSKYVRKISTEMGLTPNQVAAVLDLLAEGSTIPFIARYRKEATDSLDEVESCADGVGVEVNTASRQLLTYVSGLGPQLAQNIVRHREENGPFASRKALLGVPRLGAKAFEQAAGFLRINGAQNPLDSSAVHPKAIPW